MARVKSISAKLATPDNPFKLKANESYFSVTVEAPLHILGFEEDDYSLFDYAWMFFYKWKSWKPGSNAFHTLMQFVGFERLGTLFIQLKLPFQGQQGPLFFVL